jgi:hypothetical protein
MGEAKRRKKSDPNFGDKKNKYKQLIDLGYSFCTIWDFVQRCYKVSKKKGIALCVTNKPPLYIKAVSKTDVAMLEATNFDNQIVVSCPISDGTTLCATFVLKKEQAVSYRLLMPKPIEEMELEDLKPYWDL